MFILPRTDIQSEMTLQSEFKRISLSQHFSNKRKNSIGCACIFISLNNTCLFFIENETCNQACEYVYFCEHIELWYDKQYNVSVSSIYNILQIR